VLPEDASPLRRQLYAGKIAGDFESSESTIDSAERFRRVDRRSCVPQGRILRMQQRREAWEGRDLPPSRRGKNHRDNQRESMRDKTETGI
jgi:hypothetical protein